MCVGGIEGMCVCACVNGAGARQDLCLPSTYKFSSHSLATKGQIFNVMLSGWVSLEQRCLREAQQLSHEISSCLCSSKHTLYPPVPALANPPVPILRTVPSLSVVASWWSSSSLDAIFGRCCNQSGTTAHVCSLNRQAMSARLPMLPGSCKHNLREYACMQSKSRK
eukprot:1158527-Pelagomonas_calceolata.AAC.4